MSLPPKDLRIDEALVRRLLRSQFPRWADAPVRAVEPGGWDNRCFRLGDRWVVRLPSAAVYAGQVEKEHRWLPILAPLLPLSIPQPIGIGEPGDGYPWRWSIYCWLEGDTAAAERNLDLTAVAAALGGFLCALQRIDVAGGPPPGAHNFGRGGPLARYDQEARQAIASLAGTIDVDSATDVWQAGLSSSWDGRPVWIHGDVSAGNLLLRQRRLSSVIDFGMLGIGDPACDLSIAWTLFEGESRRAFRAALPLDDDVWLRGRGWALWKASIVAAGLADTNAVEAARSWRTLVAVLKDGVNGA